MWGPISEVYWRTRPLYVCFFIFAIFQIPVAVAENLETILVCRYFGGVFASAPLAIVAEQLADFWNAADRGVTAAVFAGAVFLGPVFGPIVGGFITMSSLGWRWNEYIVIIMAGILGSVGWIMVPETFGPVLLSRRAAKIRYETKNWAIRAKSDEQQVDFKRIRHVYLIRPFGKSPYELYIPYRIFVC